MAAEIVEEKQWKQLSDPDKIRSICEKLISKNPAQVKKYASGKKKYMVSFFVGQIMKETKGMAHPELSNEKLLNRCDQRFDRQACCCSCDTNLLSNSIDN